jgi:hypothetical protein
MFLHHASGFRAVSSDDRVNDPGMFIDAFPESLVGALDDAKCHSEDPVVRALDGRDDFSILRHPGNQEM